MKKFKKILFIISAASILSACSAKRYNHLSTVKSQKKNNKSEYTKDLNSVKSSEIEHDLKTAFIEIPQGNQIPSSLNLPASGYVKAAASEYSASKIINSPVCMHEDVQLNKKEIYIKKSIVKPAVQPSLGQQAIMLGAIIAIIGSVLSLLEVTGSLTASSGFAGLGILLLILGVAVVIPGLLLRLFGK